MYMPVKPTQKFQVENSRTEKSMETMKIITITTHPKVIGGMIKIRHSTTTKVIIIIIITMKNIIDKTIIMTTRDTIS